MQIALRSVILLSLGLAACGDDSGVTDTDADTESDVLMQDDASALDCGGMADGTVCGDERICIGEVCLNTRCGDGYVNEAAGEDCDDENEFSGDGCEPASCTFSCTTEEEVCSDGDPCNGAESCSVTTHRCQAGTQPSDETECSLEDMTVGVCAGGLCAAPGCGNGTPEEGEACDDGNEDPLDGCKPDCTFTCVDDNECSDGDACTGEETCELGTHTCVSADMLSCDDEDECTADSCESEMGCVFTLIDTDEDGFAGPVCTTAGLPGGDCSVSNDSVYPGAPELCDSVDNDCDDETDEEIVEVECRADDDADGYGDEAASMSACMCPAGTIAPRPDGNVDCDDRDSNVHEGQGSFFTSRHCTGRLCGGNDPYDYDCDGRETRQYPDVGSDCGLVFDGMFGRCAGTGWVSGGVPACGIIGRLQTCGRVGFNSCTLVSTTARVQACR